MYWYTPNTIVVRNSEHSGYTVFFNSILVAWFMNEDDAKKLCNKYNKKKRGNA